MMRPTGGEFERVPLTTGADPSAFEVPPLLLNSTVVETGQRLIAAPVAIAEPAFSEALDGQQTVGPEVPLSTAVHNSAPAILFSAD